MSLKEALTETWKALTSKESTGETRIQHYAMLTRILKDTPASSDSESVLNCLNQHHCSFIQRFLSDITSESCDQTAVQALGYFLHCTDLARKLTAEQVATAINALCNIIGHKSTPKVLCVRAVWCLANQSFTSSQISSHVITIVSVVTKVLKNHEVSPSVDIESLNLLIRLDQQCEAKFSELIAVWYKAMVVRVLISKNAKVQKKAFVLVKAHQEGVHSNHELVQWLCGRLKEHTLEEMLTQLSERGVDHAHILNTWAHFVFVIGKVLHKHGTFLNRMLLIPETGFKHKSLLAVKATYKAWMFLISNFAMDLNLLVSRKRLKLLLLPLLGTSMKERHAQVEVARLRAWWHLIIALGSNRPLCFNQVCSPFLMFCLDLDPKSDINPLSSLISEKGINCMFRFGSRSTPKSDSCSTPTLKHSAPAQTLQDALQCTPGQSTGLLAAISPPGTTIGNPYYLATPTLPMLLTGCHAILQFTGNKEQIPESLIESGSLTEVTFPKGYVPLEVVQFLVLFVDSLATAIPAASIRGCRTNLDKVVNCLVSLVINTLVVMIKENAPLVEIWDIHLLEVMLHFITSGTLASLTTEQTQMTLFSRLLSLPPHLLLRSHWKHLLHAFMILGNHGNNEWLCANWVKIAGMAGSKSHTPDPLSYLLDLSDQLLLIANDDSTNQSTLTRMWTALAHSFSKSVLETTQINHGSALEPNFKAVLQILKFPFQFLLHGNDKSHVIGIFEVWRSLYDMALLHISLVVSDPNHCALLTLGELHAVYRDGQHKDAILNQKNWVFDFDMCQEAVASAVSFILHKLKWSDIVPQRTLHKDQLSDDGSKCIKKVLELLPWQLERFNSGTKESPKPLSYLTTPTTLHEIISTLFQHLPTFDLLTVAVESIAEPLASLWESLLRVVTSSPTHGKQRTNIKDQIISTWSTITTCLQARGPSPFPASLLPMLTPLLAATLTSKCSKLSNITLNFWALTFDKDENFSYPVKLKETFRQYFSTSPRPHGLQLSGLRDESKGSPSREIMDISTEVISIEESVPVSDSDVMECTETQSHSEEVIIMPHPSPSKGIVSSPCKNVCSSFLRDGQKGHASPHRPSPLSLSPGSKALDKVLNKSLGQRSNGVCKRLSMGGADDTNYVVIPPRKKACLLTERQQEVRRERRELPSMYNNLEPSLDHSPPLENHQNEELPIVIPESDDLPDCDDPLPIQKLDSAEPSVTMPVSPNVPTPSSAAMPTTRGITDDQNPKRDGTSCDNDHLFCPDGISPPSGVTLLPQFTKSTTTKSSHEKTSNSKSDRTPLISVPSSETRMVTSPTNPLGDSGTNKGQGNISKSTISSSSFDLTTPTSFILSSSGSGCVTSNPSTATTPNPSSLTKPIPQTTPIPSTRKAKLPSAALPSKSLPTLSTMPPTSDCSLAKYPPLYQFINSEQFLSQIKECLGSPILSSPQTTPTLNSFIFTTKSAIPHAVPSVNHSSYGVAPAIRSLNSATVGLPIGVQHLQLVAASTTHPIAIPVLTNHLSINIPPGAVKNLSSRAPVVNKSQPSTTQWPRKSALSSDTVKIRSNTIQSTTCVNTATTSIPLSSCSQPSNAVPRSISHSVSGIAPSSISSSTFWSTTQVTTAPSSTSSKISYSILSTTQVSASSNAASNTTQVNTAPVLGTTTTPVNITSSGTTQVTFCSTSPVSQTTQLKSVAPSSNHQSSIIPLGAVPLSNFVSLPSNVPISTHTPTLSSSGTTADATPSSAPPPGPPLPFTTYGVLGCILSNDGNKTTTTLSHPTTTSIITTNTTTTTTTTTGAALCMRASDDRPKRKRGRPKKYLETTEKISTEGDLPKRKGRPRKCFHEQKEKKSTDKRRTRRKVKAGQYEVGREDKGERAVENEEKEESNEDGEGVGKTSREESGGKRSEFLESGEGKRKDIAVIKEVEGSPTQDSICSSSDGSVTPKLVIVESESDSSGMSPTLMPAKSYENEDPLVGLEHQTQQNETSMSIIGDSARNNVEDGDIQNQDPATVEQNKDRGTVFGSNHGADVVMLEESSGMEHAVPESKEDSGEEREQSMAPKHPKEKDQSVGKDGNTTPQSHDIIPQSCDPAPQLCDITQSCDPAPQSHDINLQSRDITSQSCNPTPRSCDVSPLSRDLTQSCDVTPQSHETTPQSCDSAAPRQKIGSVLGILKHVSQFDTPFFAKSASIRHRVQFASKPDYKEAGGRRTPVKARVLQIPPSSRRTLYMSRSSPKITASPPQAATISGPVYPSLRGCTSPVEDILSALSPKFTHGLVQLVRARNITTVGEMSSLSEKQVQSLPIKSPKVFTLRNALRSFEQQELRRRPAGPAIESFALAPPPSKRSKPSAPSNHNSNSENTTTPCNSISENTTEKNTIPHCISNHVATPTHQEEDSFMMESAQTGDSPVAITLAAPDSSIRDETKSKSDLQHDVQHDHTYCLQAEPVSSDLPHLVKDQVCEKDLEMCENEVVVTPETTSGEEGEMSQELFSESQESSMELDGCGDGDVVKEMDTVSSVASAGDKSNASGDSNLLPCTTYIKKLTELEELMTNSSTTLSHQELVEMLDGLSQVAVAVCKVTATISTKLKEMALPSTDKPSDKA